MSRKPKSQWIDSNKRQPKWPQDVPFLAKGDGGHIWEENQLIQMAGDPRPRSHSLWPIPFWMPIPNIPTPKQK